MNEKKIFLLLIIGSMLIMACLITQPAMSSVLSATATSTPIIVLTKASTFTPVPTSTLEPISTPVFRVDEVEVFCPVQSDEAMRAYNEAMQAELDGDYAEAEKLFKEAIEIEPRYCDAMDNLGLLLRQQNRIDEAITWYKKSLEVKPDNTVALQNLGVAYNLQGKIELAIEVYEKLVEVSSEGPEGYYGLGTMYFYLERYEEAVVYLTIAQGLYAQEESPYVLDAQYYLGFSFFMLQDCNKVKQYHTPLYNEFSEDGGINFSLGICELELEDKDLDLARMYLLKAQETGLTLPPWVFDEIGE